MDIGTHLLTSLALARGFFPRQPWRFLMAVVLAGTLADVDLFSLLFGPSAYLSARYTGTHSAFGVAAIVALAAFLGRPLRQKAGQPQKEVPGTTNFRTILTATSAAALLHLFMDLATPQGVAIFWPLRQTRFAWDLLPATDIWILILLLGGLLLPELFALVGSEIGAKDKAPRGRNGALIALSLICLYVGGRFLLHANAAAQLDAHTYHGESPRGVAALPDSLSPFTWHGIVETASQICTTSVPAASASLFDPETSACVHKPEPSPALSAAQQTDAAQRFVRAARFPRASVNALPFGSEIAIRDVRDLVEGESRFALAARILLDAQGQVTSQRIVWARHVRLR